MKKIYVSDLDMNLEEIDKIMKKYNVVENIEDSTDVIVVPGGISAFSDIFTANKLNKNLFLYNKNMFYSDLINNLYKSHLEGYIDEAPSSYIHIESEIDNILKDMEENENDKSNDGKSSKLL